MRQERPIGDDFRSLLRWGMRGDAATRQTCLTPSSFIRQTCLILKRLRPPARFGVMPDQPKPGGDSTPKRDHLLATAFRLFYCEGYHAIGIDTILAEAKLAKM